MAGNDPRKLTCEGSSSNDGTNQPRPRLNDDSHTAVSQNSPCFMKAVSAFVPGDVDTSVTGNPVVLTPVMTAINPEPVSSIGGVTYVIDINTVYTAPPIDLAFAG